MPSKPKILKRTALCRSGKFRVEALDLQFSNGELRRFERLLGGGPAAVIIVPMVNDNEVLLVSEYGAGIDDYHWSLPKGKVDEGESYTAAANRELQEEVGFGANQLTLLKCMSQAPSYQQHWTQIVLAEQLYQQYRQGDEPEPMAQQRLSLADLELHLLSDQLHEARTIAALFLARAYLASR